jgi:periplasmic divalent cation tolerance protein
MSRISAMKNNHDTIIVFCTIPDEEKAAELSRNIVEANIAACANIVPKIRSIYRWKGEICDDPESLIIIKTRKSLFPLLKERITSLHPYEVPEIIAFDMTEAHEPYLKWLLENTSI